MAEERFDARPWIGESFNEGEDSLGQGEPVSEVVGGGQGRGAPVA